jgi:hypothetical protein
MKITRIDTSKRKFDLVLLLEGKVRSKAFDNPRQGIKPCWLGCWPMVVRQIRPICAWKRPANTTRPSPLYCMV